MSNTDQRGAQTEKSYIQINPKNGEAVAFVGKEANDIFALATLASALGLAEKGISLGKGFMTPAQLLKQAEGETGLKFKPKEFAKAKACVEALVAALKTNVDYRGPQAAQVAK